MAVGALGAAKTQRVIANAEAIAILGGVAGLAAFAFGIGALTVLALIGATTVVVLGWTVSRILAVRRRTLVIGSAPFCDRVISAASKRGEPCTARIVEDSADLATAAADARSHRIVVEGRFVTSEPSIALELLGPKREVRVVPEGGAPAVALDEPFDYPQRCFKRAVDVLVAVGLLVIILPVLVIAMVAIVIDSGRPVFFTQTRLGRGGRPFRLLKLRTMAPGGEDERHEYLRAMTMGAAGPQAGVFKPLDHARVTRVGRVLRRFSLDEVPQLLNVLKGDMSVVGPRPPVLQEAEVYDDYTWQRLHVKPGLTGLSQVNGRSALPFAEIVALDVAYHQHWSPGLELGILARTPIAVLSARGAA